MVRWSHHVRIGGGDNIYLLTVVKVDMNQNFTVTRYGTFIFIILPTISNSYFLICQIKPFSSFSLTFGFLCIFQLMKKPYLDSCLFHFFLI